MENTKLTSEFTGNKLDIRQRQTGSIQRLAIVGSRRVLLQIATYQRHPGIDDAFHIAESCSDTSKKMRDGTSCIKVQPRRPDLNLP